MSVEALHECSLKVTCFSPEPYVLSYTGMTAGQARHNLRQALKGADPAAVEKETVEGLERARAEFAFHTADCAPCEYVCNCGEASHHAGAGNVTWWLRSSTRQAKEANNEGIIRKAGECDRERGARRDSGGQVRPRVRAIAHRSRNGQALKRLEVYALGGVITAMPATISTDAGERRERYEAVRFEATARNGERRRWDASPDMTGTVINAAKRHLVEGRIPAPESKTANQ